jgi:5-formyltetrahydrofolate cyclo-ligase
MPEAAKLKAQLREEIWRELDARKIATPRPCRGRIPIFAGARVASMKVVKKSFFLDAETVYSTLDAPLQPLREEALQRGKRLVMMVPGFRGFVIVDGSSVPKGALRAAASPRGSLVYGSRVRVLEGVEVDLFLAGSLAVDKRGGRLGRGDGQQDLEYAVLRELGAIDDSTPVLTLVHDVQVVAQVPMEIHDVPADYIATPSELLKAEGGYRKPRGIVWDMIDSAAVEKYPLLKLLAGLG